VADAQLATSVIGNCYKITMCNEEEEKMLTVTATRFKDAQYPMRIPNSYLFEFTYNDQYMEHEQEIDVSKHMTMILTIDLFESCVVRALAELKTLFQREGVKKVKLASQGVGNGGTEWRSRVGFKCEPHVFGDREDRPRCHVVDCTMQLL
jgi:hypothetical protein